MAPDSGLLLELRNAPMQVLDFLTMPCEAVDRRVLEPPATIRAIQHCPDPEERPQYMECEEAYPARSMDGVLMRVIAVFGNFVGHIMDSNNPIEKGDKHKEQET